MKDASDIRDENGADTKTHRTSTEFKDSLKEDIKRRADPEVADAQRSGTTTAAVGTPENPSTDILTVSNVITLCRFLLTMAFLFLFAQQIGRAHV